MEITQFPFHKENHIFVIAEAGSNWKAGSCDEDLERATKLIETASKSGADAVKFQTFKANTVYVQKAGNVKYLDNEIHSKNINEIFDELSMPYEMIPKLAKICEKNNIMFMSSPFSVTDAKEVDPFVKIHKVASYENNHIRLLEFLAKTKKPVIVSTGASSVEEIEFLVNLWKENKGGPLALLQCTARYPAPLETLNISVIRELKKKFNVSIGLSDHSLDPIIGPLVAIGMGATIIEKHFTLDRTLPGPDHMFSLTPNELELMVKSIRKAEKAKGLEKKIILKEELELRQFATRSIQAIKDISRGDILKEGINFDVLRPGNRDRGANSRFLLDLDGKKVIRDIKAGEGIKLQDCE